MTSRNMLAEPIATARPSVMPPLSCWVISRAGAIITAAVSTASCGRLSWATAEAPWPSPCTRGQAIAVVSTSNESS